MTTEASKGFNANELSAKRESEPIEIGEHSYKPKRRTNAVMREFRRLTRRDAALAREDGRLNVKYDELPDDAPEDQRAAIEEESAAIDDKREALVYEMIAHFLVPAEDGQPLPDPEYFSDELDIVVAGKLLDYLTPKAGGEPDPTPETPESS